MLTKRFDQFEVHVAALASILMLVQGFTRFENNILSLHPNQWHLLQTTFQTFEQVVGGLAARAAALEAGAASASSGSGSANSWNWDKAMAPQPLGASGPMAQGV